MGSGRSTDREQRFVFGEVAETYHRVRPSYPDAVVDSVVARAATPGGAPLAVEIGAGTGKATVLLAPRCQRLIALEPDAEMAAVAGRTSAPWGNVEIVTTTFERWRPPPSLDGAVDLIASAQAWHWVDHSVALPLARRLLRPGGVLALFWNRPLPEQTTHNDALHSVYARVAPQLDSMRPWQQTTESDVEEIRTATGFTGLRRAEFGHAADYTTDDYIDLMRTQSNHRLLQPDHLEQLLSGLREVIDAAGGSVTVPYKTLLVSVVRD